MRINYVSPCYPAHAGRDPDELSEKGIPQAEFTRLEDVLAETDVLYVTRVQKERFEDLEEYERVKGAYVITPDDP